MAQIIKQLSNELVNKISAGEVVVSPASVIKELVENSIDAGSTHIKIEIENGGKSKILVSDNGCGIKADELSLAFSKNATSKIDNVDKLSSIDTLGFRGEALFSISVVSKVKIKTKFKDDKIGTRAMIINGKVQNVSSIALNTGTRIEVDDLFYNTPARKKHMKSAKGEKTSSLDIISKLAIANPNIAFSVYSDGREVFVTTGDNDIKNVITTILGYDFITKMIDVDYEDEPLIVKGVTLSPNYLDRQNEESIFIINGRYVKNDSLSKAINNIYREQFGLFTKRISYVLYINLPYNFTDVNVHPSKTTISFRNESLITMLICEGIRKAVRESINLNENSKIRKEKKENPLDAQIAFETAEEYVVDEKEVENKLYSIKDNEQEKEDNNLKGEIKNTIDITEFYEQSKYPSFVDFEEKPLFEENKTKEVISKDTNISDKENIVDKSIFDKISNMKFIGTAFKAYAMFESGDTIFVMDTHASHERVLYDEYLREYQNEDVRTQILAAPFVLELGVTLKDVCINNLESLRKLGYEIEDFSGSNVIIREIPEMLSIEDTKEIILNILSTLKNTSVLSNDINRNERLIKSACHHAVRGHDDISESEARKLLNDLKKSDNPFSCPHSRPTISKIKKKYFEKMFQRI
ncbi:DNA mismatch repair endonuclease MutL [Anaerofustis butyriciformans]|uniref:DNA mismatch repair endonuclease MutL n=1 Tax=Anaerofustis butyriciformans TaxID=3108533 RepID=UPI002E3065A9|nr:DNA mismatch repair endonuclease MutL [Anaerofustis sp. HA2171]